MIASAALSAASEPSRSPRTAFSRPAVMQWRGSGTPMTPVDATSTCVGRTPSRSAARAAVSRASCRPRSPVQAFAQPEFATIARMASPSFSRCSLLMRSGAALTSFVVITDAHTRSPPKSISARSRLRGLIPDATPAQRTSGTAPRPPRTSTRRISDDWDASAKTGLLRISAHDVEVLNRLSGGAFAEIVVAGHDMNDAGPHVQGDLRVVRACQRGQIRNARRIQHFDERVAGIRLHESGAHVRLVDGLARHDVGVDQHAARQRHDVRREDEGSVDPERAQLLLDLFAVPVRRDAVRANVSVDFGVHRAELRRAPGSRDAAFCIENDGCDVAREARER